MSAPADTLDPYDELPVASPILAAIDEKIAAAEQLAERYRRFRRMVEEALSLDIDQLQLEGLDLNGSSNGHETSEPAPPDPGADPPASSPGEAEAEPGDGSSSAGSEDPDPPERQGGGLTAVKQAVRREGAADRKDRSKVNERADKAVALIRAEPGLNGAAIAERLGLDQGTTSTVLNNLARGGRVRREKDGRSKRYYPPEHEVAPTDPTGCKTEVERKLYDAIATSPSPLTGTEAATLAGIRGNGSGAILQGLVRRGVLKTLPRDHDQQPQRYEVAG